jgi:hypothetical protein
LLPGGGPLGGGPRGADDVGDGTPLLCCNPDSKHSSCTQFQRQLTTAVWHATASHRAFVRVFSKHIHSINETRALRLCIHTMRLYICEYLY